MLYIGPQGPWSGEPQYRQLRVLANLRSRLEIWRCFTFTETLLNLENPFSPFFSRNLVKTAPVSLSVNVLSKFLRHNYNTIVYASLQVQTNGILGLQNIKENFNPLYPQ